MHKSKFFNMLLLLVPFQFHLIRGAAQEPTLIFKLNYPDGKSAAQEWEETNFKKITFFKETQEDFTKEKNFMYPIHQEKPYLTHEYFKNLITGNFVDHGLTQYINDYNFFIGNDIQLPDNPTYLPFPTSLKWKVFKDNEDFFRINLTFGQKSLRNTLKTFFFFDCSIKRPESEYRPVFHTTTIDLSPAQDKTRWKLSITSPYSIDYSMFEGLDNETRNNVTWLNLNNSLLLKLNLPILFKYFPNLYKLTVKNTFIKKIKPDDIDQLKRICKRNLLSNEDANNYFDQDVQMEIYALTSASLKYSQNPDLLEKIKHYSNEKCFYSFILDLRGCPIKKNCYEVFDLKDESKKIYKRTVRIKESKPTNKRSPLQKLFHQLSFMKRFIVPFFLISVINIAIIKTLFRRTNSIILRSCIGIYSVVSLAFLWFTFKTFYNKAYLINNGIVFD